MPKPYRDISNDKRHDLIRLIEKTHMTVKKASECLQINYSSAKNIVGHYNKTGILEKGPKTGNHKSRKLTDEELLALRNKVDENRTITLDKLKKFVLDEYKKDVSTSSIWNYIKSLRHKKKPSFPVHKNRWPLNIKKTEPKITKIAVKREKKGEEYTITEYPSGNGIFTVVMKDTNDLNVFESSGHIGDHIILELWGNTLSYLICGHDDDGNIRKTKVFVDEADNYYQEINDYDQPENNIVMSNNVASNDGVLNTNQEEYFIAEETVLTNNLRQQVVRLSDKNDNVLDTKYGHKDDIIRLQLSDKVFEYVIQGPIITKLIFDKSNGFIAQESDQHASDLDKKEVNLPGKIIPAPIKTASARRKKQTSSNSRKSKPNSTVSQSNSIISQSTVPYSLPAKTSTRVITPSEHNKMVKSIVCASKPLTLPSSSLIRPIIITHLNDTVKSSTDDSRPHILSKDALPVTRKFVTVTNAVVSPDDE